MLKSAQLVFALTFLMAMTLVTFEGRNAVAKGNDQVFLDEGDGDFGDLPKLSQKDPLDEQHIDDAPTIVPSQPKEQPPVKKVATSPKHVDDIAPEQKPEESLDDVAAAVADHPSASDFTEEKDKAEKVNNRKDVHHAASHKAAVAGGFFMHTTKPCPMLRAPASTDEPVSFTKFPRKIWVEKFDGEWAMAYTKDKTPAYVSAECVKN